MNKRIFSMVFFSGVFIISASLTEAQSCSDPYSCTPETAHQYGGSGGYLSYSETLEPSPGDVQSDNTEDQFLDVPQREEISIEDVLNYLQEMHDEIKNIFLKDHEAMLSDLLDRLKTLIKDLEGFNYGYTGHKWGRLFLPMDYPDPISEEYLLERLRDMRDQIERFAEQNEFIVSGLPERLDDLIKQLEDRNPDFKDDEEDHHNQEQEDEEEGNLQRLMELEQKLGEIGQYLT